MTPARYWLVNSGTTQDPLVSRPMSRYREWHATEGQVHGFSRRPVSIRVGDILIQPGRVVTGRPDRGDSGGRRTAGPPRWAMALAPAAALEVRMLDHRDRPKAADLGIAARGVRTYKELDAVVGRRAVERVQQVGEPFS